MVDEVTQAEIDARFFAIVTDPIGTPTELVDEYGHIAWHTRTTLWGTTTWNRDATPDHLGPMHERPWTRPGISRTKPSPGPNRRGYGSPETGHASPVRQGAGPGNPQKLRRGASVPGEAWDLVLRGGEDIVVTK
nr:RHS domain-containing protein [Streptomyces taklimakanensis]